MLNPNAPILGHLEEFLDTTSPASPEAKAEARELYNFFTRRHTFMGRLADHTRGLLFGVNALVVNPVSEKAYLQHHAKLGAMLPPGGKMEGTDFDDITATGLRELLEEAPVFAGIINGNHAMDNPVLLDVHYKQGAPGADNWWFFTIGFWAPPFARKVEKGGRWQSLHNLVYGDDIANARSAQRVLNDLAGLRQEV